PRQGRFRQADDDAAAGAVGDAGAAADGRIPDGVEAICEQYRCHRTAADGPLRARGNAGRMSRPVLQILHRVREKHMSIQARHAALTTIAIAALFSFAGLASAAQIANADRFTGGPKGVVKNDAGEPLEGIMVQLLSPKTNIRTTVYSNLEGRYEFPKREA